MTAIEQTSVFNVEASLNAYMAARLATITRPTWLTTMPGIVSLPIESTASLPAFSFHHLPVGIYDRWQGRAVGAGKKGRRAVGIMEVDCWVTRGSTHWEAQRRTMKDMVLMVLNRASEVVIQDYEADTDDPTTTSYLVRWLETQMPQTAHDPNPDIERARILATYTWVYRS